MQSKNSATRTIEAYITRPGVDRESRKVPVALCRDLRSSALHDRKGDNEITDSVLKATDCVDDHNAKEGLVRD